MNGQIGGYRHQLRCEIGVLAERSFLSPVMVRSGGSLPGAASSARGRVDAIGG
ncbi:MAG: hypothetical protein U9R74_12120 [Pseudomonadota bacterium]|nr:hypothetical protein [Pseudomonadota bacterium]